MPHVTCYHIAIGEKDEESNVAITFKVGGFKKEIITKGYSGNDGTLYWLFILN